MELYFFDVKSEEFLWEESGEKPEVGTEGTYPDQSGDQFQVVSVKEVREKHGIVYHVGIRCIWIS